MHTYFTMFIHIKNTLAKAEISSALLRVFLIYLITSLQCLYPLENVDFTLFFAIYLLIYSIFTPILSQYFQFSYFFFFLFF